MLRVRQLLTEVLLDVTNSEIADVVCGLSVSVCLCVYVCVYLCVCLSVCGLSVSVSVSRCYV